MVHVRLPAVLRDLGDGRPTVAVDLREGGTIADLLDAVGAAHPALQRRIRDEQGRLRAHVNLFVGDDDVRTLAGVDTALEPGDEVTVLPAISGG